MTFFVRVLLVYILSIVNISDPLCFNMLNLIFDKLIFKCIHLCSWGAAGEI